jgi:hypothetical protein
VPRFILAANCALYRVVDAKGKPLRLHLDVCVEFSDHLAERRMLLVKHLVAEDVHVLRVYKSCDNGSDVEEGIIEEPRLDL